jgi:hypothetical protein
MMVQYRGDAGFLPVRIKCFSVMGVCGNVNVQCRGKLRVPMVLVATKAVSRRCSASFPSFKIGPAPRLP